MKKIAGLFFLALLIGSIPFLQDMGANSSGPSAHQYAARRTLASVSISPFPPASSRLSLPETFAQQIANDELCDDEGSFWHDMSRKDRPPTAVYRALVLASGQRDADPCMLAALSMDKAEILKLTRRRDEPACLFTRALLLTNQLNATLGKFPQARAAEKTEGVRLLRELSNRDPRQALYAVFLLGALHEARQPTESAYADLLRTDRFNSPLAEIVIRNLELGQSNVTAWFAANEISHAMAFPNYYPAQEALKEFRENALYGESLRRWATSLSEEMVEIDKQGWVEPLVSLADLGILRSFARKGLSAVFPGERTPPLFSQPEWVPYFRRRVGWPANDDALSLAGLSCRETRPRMREQLPDLVARQNEWIAAWRARR